MERQIEGHRPKGSVTERIKRRLDHVFHPASSASEDAFRSIIAVLPPGEMKKSMEMVTPQLRDLLKVQDRSLVIGSFLQRVIASVNFGVFGGIGGLFVEPVTGPFVGAAIGVASANALPTPSQMERSRIAMTAKQQEMMLRTSGGKEAAKVFDAKRVDQITQAILWGTGAQGGAGGVLSQAANPMT
ncbi:hypothetical protein HZB58_04535 [Candidatus Gottesmanbacteria bacterium]|nr:hypothetical protein [Candidatus Gottesmanbacteria bacterium]